MNRLPWLFTLFVLCLPSLLGCGDDGSASAVADQDEPEAYVAEHDL